METRTYRTQKLGSLSTVRPAEKADVTPAVTKIEKEPDADNESKSRKLLSYAQRQHAMGKVEIAVKYTRRILDSYGDTAAASEAQSLIQQWKESEPFREWTDVTKKFKTIAKFIRLDKGTVYLMNKAGKVIAVELDRLSRRDQLYVMHREGI